MNTTEPTESEQNQLKCLQDQTLAGRCAALSAALSQAVRDVRDVGRAWCLHIKKVL